MLPALRPCPAVAEPTTLPCGSAGVPSTAIGGGTVVAVPDGRTLLLADGREVLLAGLEVAPADTPAGRAARTALAVAAEGRAVVLAPATAPGGRPVADRWGRMVAWAAAEGGPPGAVPPNPLPPVPLQLALLAQGHARVAARVDDEACLPALRAAERAARAANLGLWSDPVYAAVPAERPAEILKRRGGFAVVVGQIDSVRESGGTIYLNFGRRWAEAFAATIPKRIERTLAASGLVPGRLAGRRIEVRGVVEQRGGGPRIEIVRAEQLALDGAGSTPSRQDRVRQDDVQQVRARQEQDRAQQGRPQPDLPQPPRAEDEDRPRDGGTR
ncbi:thermonuclease family protein [Rhodoplanes sp. SY1]|uniref:thermonuclease family protein n=1 Tax=Rhodoplanes sp. SY1 TaxID=3166646 RepID=UPI0038B4D6FD